RYTQEILVYKQVIPSNWNSHFLNSATPI
ncbi:hypothetical protein CP03DC29_0046B, partial [Chlamydia psittaci 03DC29]